MRIISKFHDYYDTALGYGADETVVYQRKTQELPSIKVDTEYLGNSARRVITTEEFKFLNDFSIGDYHHPQGFTLSAKVVLFCGMAYQVFQCHTSSDPAKSARRVTHPDQIVDMLMADKYHRYSEKNARHVVSNARLRRGILQRGEYLDTVLIRDGMLVVDAGADLFFEMGEPVALVEHGDHDYIRRISTLKITTNPVLKDLGFQSSVVPYMAFQEISQFIGGVLGVGHPKMVEISDRDMQNAKGFDHPYSFRKEPTKR